VEWLSDEDDPPVVRVVDLIINLAIKDRATHVHIDPEAKSLRVRYRVDGTLHEAMTPPKMIQSSLLRRVKRLASMDLNVTHLPQKGEMRWHREGDEYSLEVSSCPTIHGERLVLSVNNLSLVVPAPNRLGLEPTTLERLRSLVNRQRGLLLVAGPPGSGRSTLIASQLGRCADGRNGIFCDTRWKTAIHGVQQIQLNPAAGFTVEGLISDLRDQDCDLLGVSEFLRSRDLEALCEFTAERGMALAAWPAEDAAEAFTTLCGTGVEPHLLSVALAGILSLRLLPTLCECKVEEQDHDVLTKLLIDEPVLRKRNGCDLCHMTGVHGRTMVAELLVMNDELRALLHRRPTSDEVRAASGHSTLFEQALGLARRGVIEARDCLTLWPSLGEP
jgi:type IV pilus assembly protein PilB